MTDNTQTDRVVTVDRDEGVFLIGLNRVDKRNAVNMAMIRQLSEAYTEFERDDSARVALVHAHGDHFCGGLELAEVAEPLMAPGAAPIHVEGGVDPWGIQTARASKPVIIAVQGYTLTVAIEMCLMSDIVIAADNAQFAQLEISRGLFPIGGATTRWPLASGYQNAMRYLLTGDFFDAEEARRIGLVQDIVKPEDLQDYALAMAKRVAAHAPLGVKATLRTARKVQDHGQQAAADMLYPEIRAMYSSDDAKVGIRTFMDKERPTYTGK